MLVLLYQKVNPQEIPIESKGGRPRRRRRAPNSTRPSRPRCFFAWTLGLFFCWDTHGKSMRNLRENQSKTMGKPWENHGKTHGKMVISWENHGKNGHFRGVVVKVMNHEVDWTSDPETVETGSIREILMLDEKWWFCQEPREFDHQKIWPRGPIMGASLQLFSAEVCNCSARDYDCFSMMQPLIGLVQPDRCHWNYGPLATGMSGFWSHLRIHKVSFSSWGYPRSSKWLSSERDPPMEETGTGRSAELRFTAFSSKPSWTTTCSATKMLIYRRLYQHKIQLLEES